MSAGKIISLAKAKADFGAMLRLAEHFDFVKIMHGNRLVGVFTSGQRWQKRGWFIEMESLPPGALAEAYDREDDERLELEEAFANALSRISQPRKSKPIRVVKARKVAGRWVGAKVRLSRKRIVAAIRADREAR